MKEIELTSLDTKLYQETLDNGLEVYMVPYSNKENYYITYATKFGSDVLKFDFDGKPYKPPLGIAHYLEHKMFEEESGIDPFTFFAKTGTDANAMTSFDSTQYLCSGTKNFKENLRYLLGFVNRPYFTDENVEKERGIIAEEIKMYEALPDYVLDMKLREVVYNKLGRKYDIAGTEKEINKITKEDLYKCYNSFYVPNNMFIVITGNFNTEEALDVIKEELSTKERKELAKVITPKEEKNVAIKELKLEKDIEVPKLGIGIKLSKKDLELKDIELDLYLGIFMTILFGSSSEFREKVRNQKILNDIYMEWEKTDDYKTFFLFATTKDPDKLLSEINKELKKKKVSKESFDRIKKVWIANEVKMIDNIEKTANNIYDDIINYNTVIENRIDIIKKLDYSTLNKLIRELDLKNKSVIRMVNK